MTQNGSRKRAVACRVCLRGGETLREFQKSAIRMKWWIAGRATASINHLLHLCTTGYTPPPEVGKDWEMFLTFGVFLTYRGGFKEESNSLVKK